MGTEDNVLTLEGLAWRLEAQGRENAERLEKRERVNARLRDEVAAFRDSDTGDIGRDGVVGVPSTPRIARTEAKWNR